MKIGIVCQIGNLEKFGYHHIHEVVLQSFCSFADNVVLISSSREPHFRANDSKIQLVSSAQTWFDLDENGNERYSLDKLVSNDNIGLGILTENGFDIALFIHINQYIPETHFESLRHYTQGDDMSRVEWKATAKRARLVVKNYEPERQQSVLVAIDVGRATAGEFEGISRLDYLVNAALMLAYVSLRQGDWFSLVAFSDRIESYLPPVRGIKSIDRVARALYELEPRLVEADYAAACRFLGLKNRKRSLICLMTDVIDREASSVILEYMARFARYHLPLAVTLANPELRRVAWQPLASEPDPFAKATALDVLQAREEALATMRRQGVGVLDVSPHSLSPDLINRYLSIKATRRL